MWINCPTTVNFSIYHTAILTYCQEGLSLQMEQCSGTCAIRPGGVFAVKSNYQKSITSETPTHKRACTIKLPTY